MSRLPEDKRLQFVPQEDRPPLTPQLALRVAIIGSVALALFAVIFFRLWFLEVLSGNQYLAQASVNYVRNVELAAPRGQILDRNGTILASTRRAYAVEILPPNLPVALSSQPLGQPPAADVAVYNRLANVLHMSTKDQKCPVNGHGMLHLSQVACLVAQSYAQLPYANATVATDIPSDVVYYLSERQAQFPAITVQQIYQRTYPQSQTAAQALGMVGRITPLEVKQRSYRGVSQNDVIGQSGLESAYDSYLRGTDGAEKVKVDALGNFKGYGQKVSPATGHTLKVSLDAKLQAAGERALTQSIQANYPANGGAFVAMNPVNGEVYGMGSYPSYDANIFTKPIPQSVYSQLNNASSAYPLINRATQSVGPTGSTFKPITATAALESGVWGVGSTYDDTGQYCISTQCRRNAGGAAFGVLDLVNAIRVSDDVFFYNLGALLNSPNPNGGALQHWAHLYGVGRKTGVDLPGEATGNLPSPKWRAHINQLEVACEKRRHVPTCGIADGRPWSVGDNISLAVGQGDVQVTPLQLATAYAAVANGGTVVRPHLGLGIQAPDGTVLQRIDPAPARRINASQTSLDTIKQGMRAAASQPGGTSADVFGTFPKQVYGKTGTAQYNGQQDYAWYACFVPPTATSKPIVVVVWVEQGGFGDVAAAPVAKQILSQWFFGKAGSYTAGNSHTL
jgi:penicillin-binding protein 2